MARLQKPKSVRIINGLPALFEQTVAKLDHILEVIDVIKNGVTVKTGEFEALTRIYTGQKMYVDTRDTSFAPHIMLEGIWEPEITKVWRSQIRPHDIVLDVGANFGYYGLVASASLDFKTGSQVHFIEPNPHLTPLIAKTVSVNGLLKYARIEQAAISDHQGSVSFNLVKDQWCSSSINDAKQLKSYTGIEYEIEETINAPLMSIDQYCLKAKISDIGVIKLDVEGFEDKAFAGMSKTIKASPSLRLFLEFTIDAYDDPRGFFKKLRASFKSIQVIEQGSGRLIATDTYGAMVRVAYDRWAMLLLSN